MVPDFSSVASDRTRSNGLKENRRKFDPNMRKNFTLRAAEH